MNAKEKKYFVSDLFAVLEGGGTIFRESEIKKMGSSVFTKLFLLFNEIRSTDVADDTLLF